jgi:hypothetical protein
MRYRNKISGFYLIGTRKLTQRGGAEAYYMRFHAARGMARLHELRRGKRLLVRLRNGKGGLTDRESTLHTS